jgi:hypothetical protein
MPEGRLAQLPPGLAIEARDGLVLVDVGQSQEDATRAVLSPRLPAERRAVAPALALAYGSPISTPIPAQKTVHSRRSLGQGRGCASVWPWRASLRRFGTRR